MLMEKKKLFLKVVKNISQNIILVVYVNFSWNNDSQN